MWSFITHFFSSPPGESFLTILAGTGIWTFFIELVKLKFAKKSGVQKSIDELSKKIVSLESKVVLEENKIRETDAKTARIRIIRFNDEIIGQMRHSRTAFHLVLQDCKDYEKYCRDNPEFENGIATEAIANIRQTYRHVEQEHDFLS